MTTQTTNDRPPNVTPIHADDVDASAELEVVAELADRSSKIVGLVIAIFTLIALPTGAVIWLVGYVGDMTKSAVEASAPRELYDEHVRQAEKTDERLERKIDKIGEKAYGDEKKWTDAVEEKKPE